MGSIVDLGKTCLFSRQDVLMSQMSRRFHCLTLLKAPDMACAQKKDKNPKQALS